MDSTIALAPENSTAGEAKREITLQTKKENLSEGIGCWKTYGEHAQGNLEVKRPDGGECKAIAANEGSQCESGHKIGKISDWLLSA